MMWLPRLCVCVQECDILIRFRLRSNKNPPHMHYDRCRRPVGAHTLVQRADLSSGRHWIMKIIRRWWRCGPFQCNVCARVNNKWVRTAAAAAARVINSSRQPLFWPCCGLIFLNHMQIIVSRRYQRLRPRRIQVIVLAARSHPASNHMLKFFAK
jgi:hypothetical protein